MSLDGHTFALAQDRTASLNALTVAPVREVVARVRAPKRTKIAVSIDGARIGSDTVDGDWTVIRMNAPKQIAPGRHGLELRSRTTGLAVDWVWLRSSETTRAPTPDARVEALRVGKRARRALVARTARTYRYYLHVPPDATLRFAYGASAPVVFAVRATAADGTSRALFEQTATTDRWRKASVDLSAYAGKAMRLELETRGDADTAGWGEVEMVVPRAKRRRPAKRRTARNAIVVIMDTTRADAFAPGSKAHTPSYDALAKRSTVFRNAYNAENWTLPSTASTMSGLYSFTHGAQYAGDGVSDQVELLPEHLDAADFNTKAVVANAVVSEKFGFKQGWDEWLNTARSKGPTGAEHVYGDAIEWLDQNADKGRFLLYVHSMDAHTPYSPPPEHLARYYEGSYRGWIGSDLDKDDQRAIEKRKRRASKDDLAWAEALYYGEVTYQDEHLGRLIAKVRELGLLDDTIIVVTNDHGEELYEHKGMGHGFTLYEEQIRAPLLVHYPPLFPPGTVDVGLVEHVDVAPTIVDALGLPPLADAEGASLVPRVTGAPVRRPDYAVYAHRKKWRGVRVGRWKLNVSQKRGWLGLFDLVADPTEARDHREDRPIAGRLCEIYLGEALASPNKRDRLRDRVTRRSFAPSAPQMDTETRKQLEALGYL